MAKKRAVYDVTPEQFVLTWQASESADEVARKLNMPKNIVLARASNYRDMGVKLKKMKRVRKGIDVAQLNELINSGGRVAAAAQTAKAPVEKVAEVVAQPGDKKRTIDQDKVDEQIASVLRGRLNRK